MQLIYVEIEQGVTNEIKTDPECDTDGEGQENISADLRLLNERADILSKELKQLNLEDTTAINEEDPVNEDTEDFKEIMRQYSDFIIIIREDEEAEGEGVAKVDSDGSDENSLIVEDNKSISIVPDEESSDAKKNEIELEEQEAESTDIPKTGQIDETELTKPETEEGDKTELENTGNGDSDMKPEMADASLDDVGNKIHVYAASDNMEVNGTDLEVANQSLDKLDGTGSDVRNASMPMEECDVGKIEKGCHSPKSYSPPATDYATDHLVQVNNFQRVSLFHHFSKKFERKLYMTALHCSVEKPLKNFSPRWRTKVTF